MTSLSIKSNNAIKSSPGNSHSEDNPDSNSRDLEFLPVSVPAFSFLSKAHLNRISASIRSPELILVFILSLCVFFGLLSLRSFDDNRLTSWYWLFSNADLLAVSMCLVGGLLAGLLFINISASRNLALGIIIFLSIVISVVHWGNPEVILDAGRYFSQAKYLELFGVAYFLDQWGRGIMAWTDLPLVPFIYGVIFKVFGESRFAIQVVNTVFFTGTIYLVYCLGSRFWSQRIGLYAASCLLSIPYLHTQVPLMMVDVPAMFFLTLAVYLYVRLISVGGKGNTVLAATSILLAILCKYTNWLMLSILPVISCVYFYKVENPEHKKQVLERSMDAIVLFSLLAIIPLVWGYDIFVTQIGLLVNYQLAILDGWTESHISTFIYQMHPFIALLAILSLYFAYKMRDVKILIAAWMLLLIFILDVERIRYVLIAFPMLALMAGYAIAHINRDDLRRYLMVSILVTSSTVSVLGHASFLREHSAINLQAAANYLNKIDLPGVVEVITLDQVSSSVNPIISLPLFDMYSHNAVIQSHSAGKEVNGLSDQQQNSTLRFTWEYKVPVYYEYEKQQELNIIAIIRSDNSQVLPVEVREKLSGYFLDKSFNQDEGIFRYKTIVDIYLPVGNGK